jgi:hypothetical protein
MPGELLFEIVTPLAFEVRCTRSPDGYALWPVARMELGS